MQSLTLYKNNALAGQQNNSFHLQKDFPTQDVRFRDTIHACVEPTSEYGTIFLQIQFIGNPT